MPLALPWTRPVECGTAHQVNQSAFGRDGQMQDRQSAMSRASDSVQQIYTTQVVSGLHFWKTPSIMPKCQISANTLLSGNDVLGPTWKLCESPRRLRESKTPTSSHELELHHPWVGPCLVAIRFGQLRPQVPGRTHKDASCKDCLAAERALHCGLLLGKPLHLRFVVLQAVSGTHHQPGLAWHGMAPMRSTAFIEGGV